MPKTLNAFFLLTSVLTDENLVDIKPRDFSHTEASAERLNAYGSTTHGESFQGMTEMARKFLPDLGEYFMQRMSVGFLSPTPVDAINLTAWRHDGFV